MNVLGLKIRRHDPGAALISNGRVVAISEERLVRIKRAKNIFPQQAIDYCLRECNLTPADLDLIVIDQTGHQLSVRLNEYFHSKCDFIFLNNKIETLNHHTSHAASTFFASPFKSAAIFVADGAGERFNVVGKMGYSETETLYRGEDTSITELQKALHQYFFNKDTNHMQFVDTFGLGKFYSTVSNSYLRFGSGNPGKLMGLAPYGSASLLGELPVDTWGKEEDGKWVCRRPVFPRPHRTIELLPDDYYASVAYATQKVFEKGIIWWTKRLYNLTASENLCMAGGSALNIDANRRVLDESGFKRVFIQPASSDSGIPLGCALWGYHVMLKQPRFFTMRSASLGHRYTQEEIESALAHYNGQIEFELSTKTTKADIVASLIAQGEIVAWFYGGAEYGPRALGNRSILADPRRSDMKDILNNRVKHRESWRPFGASILLEEMSEWFDLTTESPFMLLVGNIRHTHQDRIPAVIHVDGTSRLQTVTKEDNGDYYDLIAAFKAQTGIPLILNTSFNLAGEPIVETPQDAISTFLSTGIDALVLEDYIVRKKHSL